MGNGTLAQPAITSLLLRCRELAPAQGTVFDVCNSESEAVASFAKGASAS
jgi:hypothetical protein